MPALQTRLNFVASGVLRLRTTTAQQAGSGLQVSSPEEAETPCKFADHHGSGLVALHLVSSHDTGAVIGKCEQRDSLLCMN